MKQQVQDADQDTYMKAADGQDMSNTKPGKCLAVIGRNQGTHSQQHGRGIGSGFPSERGYERSGQPVSQGRNEACKGKTDRILYCQAVFAIHSYSNAALQEGFPKIIAVRIVSSPRMIQGCCKGDRFPRKEGGMIFIGIKGPVGASGQGTSVQRDVRQSNPVLTKGSVCYLIRNYALNIVFSFRRKIRMEGKGTREKPKHNRKDNARGKTQPPLQEEHG